MSDPVQQHLICVKCGAILSRAVELIDEDDTRIVVVDEEVPFPQGVAARLIRERVPPYGYVYAPKDRERIEYWLHPDDIRYGETVRLIADSLRGYCSETDELGPNASCICGETIGTEFGDFHLIYRFEPLEGSTRFEPANGSAGG